MKDILDSRLKASEDYFLITNPFTNQSFNIIIQGDELTFIDYSDDELSVRLQLTVDNSIKNTAYMRRIVFVEPEISYGAWCRIFLFLHDIIGIWLEHKPISFFEGSIITLNGAWSNGRWVDDYSIKFKIKYTKFEKRKPAHYNEVLFSLSAQPFEWEMIFPEQPLQEIDLDASKTSTVSNLFKRDFSELEPIISQMPYYRRKDKKALLFFRYLELNLHRAEDYATTRLYGYGNTKCIFSFHCNRDHTISGVREPTFYFNDENFDDCFHPTHFYQKKCYSVTLQPSLNHELILTLLDVSTVKPNAKPTYPLQFIYPTHGLISKETNEKQFDGKLVLRPEGFGSGLRSIECNKYYQYLSIKFEPPIKQHSAQINKKTNSTFMQKLANYISQWYWEKFV